MDDDHTYLRLVKKGAHTDPNTGVVYTSGQSAVVAYLAPNFSVTPLGKNKLFIGPRTDGLPPVVRDELLIVMEVVIQGAFLSTPDLPSAHAVALRTLFNKGAGATVTAEEQALRVWAYFLTVGGPFELYWGDLQFKAETDGAVNIVGGIFPNVCIDEFRPPHQAGRSRHEYVFKFVPGVADL